MSTTRNTTTRKATARKATARKATARKATPVELTQAEVEMTKAGISLTTLDSDQKDRADQYVSGKRAGLRGKALRAWIVDGKGVRAQAAKASKDNAEAKSNGARSVPDGIDPVNLLIEFVADAASADHASMLTRPWVTPEGKVYTRLDVFAAWAHKHDADLFPGDGRAPAGAVLRAAGFVTRAVKVHGESFSKAFAQGPLPGVLDSKNGVTVRQPLTGGGGGFRRPEGATARVERVGRMWATADEPVVIEVTDPDGKPMATVTVAAKVSVKQHRR